MTTSALTDVEEVVAWLTRTEQRIGALYTKAAAIHAPDAVFSRFLSELAEDEQSHARFMAAAGEQLRGMTRRPALDIVLDRKTRDHVQQLLTRFERVLARPDVSKRETVEYLARAESSELNPLFLYITAEYRKAGREGERMTGEVQGHLLRIQDFIDDLPRALRPSIDVATLPFVGETRFLVVDDHGPLRKLVASLLARRGAVDTACEGHEALERLREHFHDGIISDIHMPGMDGLEFHRRAVAYDSQLSRRFLFYSSDMSPENATYLREHDVPFLRKPFGLQELHEAVDRLLSGDRRIRMRPPN